MASKCRYKLCRVCGSPHGKSLCPVVDLNASQELAAGIVPEEKSSKEFQIRALRRLWLMPAHKDDAPVAQPVEQSLRKAQVGGSIPSGGSIDANTAAERLRQAWGVRA